MELVDIGEGENKIFTLLEFSYRSLTFSLKSCFTYCALFPKDFEIEKNELLYLWMAQGYVVLLHRGQKIEDAAEEHFLILLRRCFFQDVKKDKFGDVVSFKIHDLIHDVAQKFYKEELFLLNSITNNLKDRNRNLFCVGDIDLGRSLCGNKIRSFICRKPNESLMVRQIGNWKCLRVLDLSYQFNVKRFPDSIGKLMLLRYLNLSYNIDLEELPHSFIMLHNLQTLVLCGCRKLKELPKDFCKLIKLRHLDLNFCHELACMPLSMDKLTNLRVLSVFVVGETDRKGIDPFQDLKALTKIKGDIEIKIDDAYLGHKEGINREERYLKSMEYLNGLKINFLNKECADNHEAILETLEPPLNLKDLNIYYYKGKIIPCWNSWAISLNHLVYITLYDCENLMVLSILSKLPHLKNLNLLKLFNLEYLECDGSKAVESETFFPSLEFLKMEYLYKLREWRTEEGLVDDNDKDRLLRKAFRCPRLSTLWILDCPNLMSVLCCPHLSCLYLFGGNERLKIITGEGNSEQDFGLRDVEIDKVCYLKSLAMSGIYILKITKDEEVECLSQVRDAFQRCMCCPHTLKLESLKNLRTLYGLNHHLITSLKELYLYNNEQLSIAEDDEEPWKSYLQYLRYLEFNDLPKMTSLPKGMQFLTSLQTLNIWSCENMKSLPEWISCLSSLHSLYIYGCPAMKSLPEAISNLISLKHLKISNCLELFNRYKEPDGVDCLKIQHISKRDIYLC